MEPITAFRDQCAEAAALLSAPDTRGISEVESTGMAIRALVGRHPELRIHLVDRFVRLSRGGSSLDELLAYCMHWLTWSEVRDALERGWAVAMTEPGWRAIPVLQQLLAAFEDEWEDGELFPSLMSSRCERD